MSSPRRIALLMHALHIGGSERAMSELANEYARTGHDVHVILFGRHRDIAYTLDPAVTLHRPPFAFNNRWRRIFTLRTMWFVRATIRKLNPWVALSFGQYWNSFVLLSLLGTGTPVMVSDRSRPDKPLSWLQERLRSWLYPRAAGIIAQTGYAESFMRRKGLNQHIAVIGNPIRQIPVQPQQVREKVVLTVGRLIQTKHHDELIRAFLAVAPRDWRLIIVGDDALQEKNRDRLEALIQAQGAEDRIELAGKQTHVEEYYRKSSIFAFTSSSEGFPNVIGEAQSAGLPVVAFDCVAGPSELIQDGRNGYLVPLFDYETFGQRLRLLMDTPELRERLGAAASQSIQHHAVPAIASRFMAFFEACRAGNGNTSCAC